MSPTTATSPRSSSAESPAVAAPLHVIFGAGQIGLLLAEQLLARGRRVRLVRRGAPGATRTGLEWMRGDLSDPAFAAAAARGAAVVYQCTEPPYDQWLEQLAPLWRGALQGVSQTRARYVILDNLYMYGRTGGRPLAEDAPVNPVSRKGELRARLAAEALAAHQRGDVRVSLGRASDFVGPGTTIATVFHGDFYRGALAGKAAQVPGDPDQVHSYSYSPDVAAGLATLGEHEAADGQVWHLPVVPAESTRASVTRLQTALLGSALGVEGLSDAALAQIGEQVPVVREVVEMTYLFKEPLVVDDARFRTAFGQSATPIAEGVRATADWARHTFGA